MSYVQAVRPVRSGSPAVRGLEPLLRSQRVLVVEAPAVVARLAVDGARCSVVAARMATLGVETIARIAPEAVVGPLIARDWDILDLALMLERAGFRGTLCALTRRLPHAELVLRELREACPPLSIMLLESD